MNAYDEEIKKAGLNKQQRYFCKLPAKKNIRLLAPAGCGKTYSLLWRCKYINDCAKEKETPIPHFLIVTFTKSARVELEERIKKDKAFKGLKATIRTLNAWGWEQIKASGKELIAGESKRAGIVEHSLRPVIEKFPSIDAIVRGGKNKKANARLIMDLIDLHKSLGFRHGMNKNQYKNQLKEIKEQGLFDALQRGYDQLLRAETLLSETEEIKKEAIAEFFEFWKKAVIQIEAENYYTFEDQKYWAREYMENQLLNNKTPQGITRYSHIIVDEFQDINPLDLDLLKCIIRYHESKDNPVSITIVGDDDQAIFGWRGTTPRFILNPEKYFGRKFETCVLETNYRCPEVIVELSKKLISYNRNRVDKDMRSVAKGRAVIKVVSSKKLESSIDQTMKAVRNVLKKESIHSVALIGRTQTALFPYQVLLSNEEISYYVDMDLDIFEGEAMKSLQDIIQIVYQAKNNNVFHPIDSLIQICDKIDRYSISKKETVELKTFLNKKKIRRFSDAINALDDYPQMIKKNVLPKRAKQVICRLIGASSVYELMKCVEEDLEGLDKDYSKKELDVHYKEPQFFRLREISKRYGDDFLRFHNDIENARKNVELSRTVGQLNSPGDYDEITKTRVHLMTATRAKGHEYDAVVILDAEDNVWPNTLSDDIEEERRLFYVAITRAKKELYFVTSEDILESRFLLETRVV